jgi:predicted nuclease of predicted toxin-antitoxin system
LKLLLDEMWPPSVAVQLRRRGHDIVAVAERPDLRTAQDAVVFGAAQAEERAIVAENVRDFRILAAYELARGSTHHGLILTSNRSFPRHVASSAGRLVTALDRLLSEEPDGTSREFWLS